MGSISIFSNLFHFLPINLFSIAFFKISYEKWSREKYGNMSHVSIEKTHYSPGWIHVQI